MTVPTMRIYLAVLLGPEGNLMLAGELGNAKGFADRMTRIINSAEHLCTVLAAEFHNSQGEDFARLAEASMAMMRATQAVRTTAAHLVAFSGKAGTT